MKTNLNWIESPLRGQLAIMPRPRGGPWLYEEIQSWKAAGADVVVSLLKAGEARALDLSAEEETCHDLGISFFSHPIEDRSVPASQKSAFDFSEKMGRLINKGSNVVIHCRQGVGRAGLMAACILIESGLDLETALHRIKTARGVHVPETAEQKRWLIAFSRAIASPLFGT